MIAPMAISSLLAATASIFVPATSQLFMRSMASLRRQLAVCFCTIFMSGCFADNLLDALGAQRWRPGSQVRPS